MNHVDPQEYGWKPSDEDFTAIATEDDIVPKLPLTVCHASQATMQCNRASAARIVPLARICVVAATNFVKILIRRKL